MISLPARPLLSVPGYPRLIGWPYDNCIAPTTHDSRNTEQKQSIHSCHFLFSCGNPWLSFMLSKPLLVWSGVCLASGVFGNGVWRVRTEGAHVMVHKTIQTHYKSLLTCLLTSSPWFKTCCSGRRCCGHTYSRCADFHGRKWWDWPSLPVDYWAEAVVNEGIKAGLHD
ncbi:hypothetical protein HD806DRAFT_519206 [Xylariaceae sp. AK1471]|nr:hypothetical protein HD806DRAFT_519206 [Xylariaceae sp. AK1471]